jgi:hypothetical protein
MIDDEDIHDFLEHHGVLGMHWGTRRSGVSKTPSQKKATRDKVLKGVEIAGVVAAGAIAANYIIKKHSATKMRNIKNAERNAHAIEQIITAHRNYHMSEIAKGTREGTLSGKSAIALTGSLERNLAALKVSLGR